MSLLNEQFSKDIENAVNNYQGNMARRDVVAAYFKASVAKVLELYIETYNTNRIESDLLTVMKPDLIRAFRGAVMDNGQHSENEYAALFDQAMKEIVQGAMSRQEETVDFAGQGYRVRGNGLYVPPSVQM